MAKHKSLDTRIKDLMKEGPLVALYFTAGINLLKEEVAKMSNEEITIMFSSLIHPDRVKNNIDYIFKILNELD